MNKLASVDWPTVLKLLAGGALTGAGMGAGTSYLRHLNALQDQAKVDTSADDDVLYLHLPKNRVMRGQNAKMAADAGSTGTFIAGGMAGALGTLASYIAVRGAYQRARKKQLQHELDQAQNVYLGGLGTQASLQKGASQFGLLTKGVGSAGLAMLLAAMGSGIVANRMLQKQFPAIQGPNRGRPRKIVITHDDPEENPEVVEQEVSPDAAENIARTSMHMPKVANADCSLADLLGAAACGRCEEIRNNIMDHGVEATLDLLKGARHEKVSNLNRHLAFTWLANDPLVSVAMAPVISAEFQEGGGEWFAKAAADVPIEYHRHLVGLTEAATQECRRAVFSEFQKIATVKQAEMGEGGGLMEGALLAGGLSTILGHKGEKGQEAHNRPGGTNTPTSQDSQMPDVELEDQDAKKFWGEYGHLIDNSVRKV